MTLTQVSCYIYVSSTEGYSNRWAIVVSCTVFFSNYSFNWKLKISSCFWSSAVLFLLLLLPFHFDNSRFSFFSHKNRQWGKDWERERKKLMRKWNNLCISVVVVQYISQFPRMYFLASKKERISSFAVDVGFLSEGNCVYNVFFLGSLFFTRKGSIQWKHDKNCKYWFLKCTFKRGWNSSLAKYARYYRV